MTLIRALAVLSAGGLVFALWNVRRMLQLRQDREHECVFWQKLDNRTDVWP